jgi:hypothetical protein
MSMIDVLSPDAVPESNSLTPGMRCPYGRAAGLTGRQPSQYSALVKSLSLTCACCRPESPGGRRGHGLALTGDDTTLTM